MRALLAIPVYNEQKYVTRVLDEVRRYASDILVVDDGSTDETPLLLAKQPVEVVRHARNRGYGQSMIDAFRWATCNCYCYDWLITMDCDEQHQPASLPDFYKAIQDDDADVISGSRYLDTSEKLSAAPSDRRGINGEITKLINERLGLNLTDSFCGFKAYRVEALRKLSLSETGYAFPLQFWVQAVANELRIRELPIALIYNDPNRSFGALNNADVRLQHYKKVFSRELAKYPDKFGEVCTSCAGATPAEESAPAQTTPSKVAR